jgi:hypothetical protein
MPPPGAQSLGYVRQVFCVVPTTADISPDGNSPAKLYNASWYTRTPPPMSVYTMSGGVLAIANGGGLVTETRRSLPGALPMLTASAGFYVEFAERISNNDPDHFPAVWLMPQEHNGAQSDRAPGDPPHFERYMELDVDEGGWNPGHHGCMLNWFGIFPNYQHENRANDPPSTFGLDRTQEHVFGLSYDPVGQRVNWWVDGNSVGGVSSDNVPAIVNSYHYYLIMSNQSHGKVVPYQMYVRYFSAWSKPDSH